MVSPAIRPSSIKNRHGKVICTPLTRSPLFYFVVRPVPVYSPGRAPLSWAPPPDFTPVPICRRPLKRQGPVRIDLPADDVYLLSRALFFFRFFVFALLLIFTFFGPKLNPKPFFLYAAVPNVISNSPPPIFPQSTVFRLSNLFFLFFLRVQL